MKSNSSKDAKYFDHALVSFLSLDYMLIIEPYADRVDITLLNYGKIKNQRIREMFDRLYDQYMVIHEHSMCMYCADDYFLTMVDCRCLSGAGCRTVKKFIPVSNLQYHLRDIEYRYEEGKLV